MEYCEKLSIPILSRKLPYFLVGNVTLPRYFLSGLVLLPPLTPPANLPEG